MKRNVTMEEISDGKFYEVNDMVKAGCAGCGGCCQGMGQSIVLSPLDIFRITSNLKVDFESLINDKFELNVVDGIILPNIKIDGVGEKCHFLDDENKCKIHGFRPDICRLFPLGRYYEERNFKYFLQINECPNFHPLKVKVKKWLDEPELKKYEDFVGQWHFFLTDVEEMLNTKNNDSLRRQVSLYILQKFYLESYSSGDDFFSQFEKRFDEAKRQLLL